MLEELCAFLGECRRSFRTTGAVLPSSRYLAAAVTARLARRGPHPVRVLEVGPATGAFTRRILRYLGPEDRLDLCEINPRFVAHLERRFGRLACGPRLRIFHSDVLDLEPGSRYDYIISGLPLNNFAPEKVAAILEKFLRLGKPGCYFSDFEYWSLRPLKASVSPRRERERLRAVEQVIRKFLARYGEERVLVWRNLPPARAYHHRLDPGSAVPSLP